MKILARRQISLRSRKTAALAADRPAVHADPKAIRPARRLGRSVVEVPDLQPPGVVPLDPFAIDRIVPVSLAGDFLCPRAAELLRAVLAMADAFAPESAPAIVGDPLGVCPPMISAKISGMYSS